VAAARDADLGHTRHPGDAVLPRLGHLLKKAYLLFTERTSIALGPLGVSSHEVAALLRFDEERQLSQAQVAARMGIDRTTMVALVDELERKGLVNRRPHEGDRRKNSVELTARGRELKRRAARIVDDCEREFLAVLDQADAQQLKTALMALISRIQEH
jgi:DNA-binding MarR family transcriptional regulator